MRRFIREHPWRLEIVPSLIFAIAVVLPLVYRRELMASAGSLPLLWPAHNAVQNWWLHHALRLCLLLSPWLMIAIANHEWVQMERRKKTNYWAPPYTAFIPLAGWYCSQWEFSPLWIALMALSPIVQYMVEGTRPFVLRPAQESPKRVSMVGIKPGEPFYYREDRGFGSNLPLLFFFLFCTMLGMVSFSDWDGGFRMLPTLAIIVLITTSTRVSFVVTNKSISARDGTTLPLLRKLGRSARIKMEEIESCGVYDYQPLERWLERNLRTYDGMVALAPKPGPCLRVQTRNGKAYLLGMEDPGFACSLINVVLAARARSEEE